MRSQFSLLIPLTCALIYVFGALAVKRSSALGVGFWRISFLSNWTIALLFVPLWFWQGGHVHPLADYWQPAITALLFLIGQSLTFLALNRGDVSVITPVLGSKVIFVALFSSFLRVSQVPLQWWFGAALSAVAILLLNLGNGRKHRNVRQSAALAFCSAMAFGFNDVLLQKWMPVWGGASFLPPMFFIVGMVSFGFIPFFSAPLAKLDTVSWRWVGPGVLLMALNNAGIAVAIGIVGSATAVNIVYSVRGLLSVLLVWLIGHWFSSDEKHPEKRVLIYRSLGAALMGAAIVLVLI